MTYLLNTEYVVFILVHFYNISGTETIKEVPILRVHGRVETLSPFTNYLSSTRVAAYLHKIHFIGILRKYVYYDTENHHQYYEKLLHIYFF
jgi:hypothetical protein